MSQSIEMQKLLLNDSKVLEYLKSLPMFNTSQKRVSTKTKFKNTLININYKRL